MVVELVSNKGCGELICPSVSDCYTRTTLEYIKIYQKILCWNFCVWGKKT